MNTTQDTPKNRSYKEKKKRLIESFKLLEVSPENIRKKNYLLESMANSIRSLDAQRQLFYND